uniref:Uncharacterized protein n=1 Tax=Periophthalmus magnuspinnatus TaxID=409849 RepID=A0A3B3ZRT1_9GOBI
VSVIELRCDIQSPKQQLTLHRTAIVMNPMINLPKGVKYVSWSPLGCDARGCCLLACLSLHHRLTIHQSHKHLEWSTQVDLSKKYGARLKERGYAKKDNVPPKASLLNFDELRRRFSMQTPVRMEWSSIYTTQQLLPNNVCEDTEIVLLAVLMENGDLVLWKFVLPFTTEEDIEFYDIIESGVDQPSDLAWWEYESGNRRMSGLIIGSQSGPVKIMPVSLTGIKGYFTLRHPVILWKETDQIAVKNIKCVPMIHSVHKASCSLIVASRGCYVFWCLLMISNAGLNIHNSHVAGLYSLPIVSLAVSQHPVAIYTCASDGWIKRLTPTFTEKSLFFKQEDIVRTENMAGRRMHGLAVSHNGAYMAIASTQGISPTTGFHPLERTYQVHFMALKSANAAAKILLSSPVQNLYKMADLLDIVRLQILEEKQIPTALQQELDKRIQEQDLMYLWKFKLFLVRTLYLSLQRPKVGVRWKPMQEVRKRLVSEEEEEAETTTTTATTTMDGEEDMQTEGETQKEVLIGHIKNKLYKQTFREHCSLCEEVLPFDDYKQATCANGHCGLSYQACQAVTFRRCLLLDSISRLPEPEDPVWIQKMLQAPCALCDSPFI